MRMRARFRFEPATAPVETRSPVAAEPEQKPVEAASEPVAPAPEPESAPEPVAVKPEPEPAPEPVAVEPEPVEPAPEVDAPKVLVAALDSLGQAHHRPFSRS
jgi:hypothetical protein